MIVSGSVSISYVRYMYVCTHDASNNMRDDHIHLSRKLQKRQHFPINLPALYGRNHYAAHASHYTRVADSAQNIHVI